MNTFNPIFIKQGSGLIVTGLALFGWGLNIKRIQNQFQQIHINIDE